MARIMAIDYGTKRVGLAVTDPLQIIASPMETVATKDIFSFIKNYCASEEVEAFVVGMPLDLYDQDTDSTPHVRGFVKKLEKLLPGKAIHLQDERYTSKMAVQSMIAAGVKKKDRRKKENIDKVSAAIILQAYLEERV